MKQPARELFLTPKDLALVPNQRGGIGIRIIYGSEQLGLQQDLYLTAELSPSEARDMAKRLLRMADAAEAE